MQEEIRQQPQAFENLWRNRGKAEKLAGRIRGKDFAFFTAFGSSHNAALYGQFLFTHFLGIPSLAAIPGFFLEQSPKLSVKKALVMAISQSGEVEEVIDAARTLRKKGACVVALTNNPSSKLASACDHLLELGAGPERSVPATKTFTTTLFNLQLITAYLGANSLLKSLSLIPDFSRRLLDEEKEVENLAARLSARSRCLLLAPESLKPIAQEGALKLKECAYMMSESFEWHEFFHGPVALMERDTPAILLRSPGDPKTSAQVERRLKKLGNFAYNLETETTRSTGDGNIAPIAYTILLQLLALHQALLKRINPDSPRRLQKVVRVSV